MTAQSARWFLGFDFYGAGNVGDDLMLAGFLEVVRSRTRNVRLVGSSALGLDCQQRRFPEIDWLAPGSFAEAAADPDPSDAWLGVGGTPFQHSVGPWFLNWLERRAQQIERFERRRLVGVGAEAELGNGAPGFERIAGLFERIGVRDRHSARVLEHTLGVDSARLAIGSDLAHLALAELAWVASTEPGLLVGLIPVADRGPSDLATEIARFVERRPSVGVACMETRELAGCERALAGAARSMLASPDTIPVLWPDYAHGSLATLVEPVSRFETIISWRYHGVLVAAWLGRRVAAVARSSKVEALARELAIPVRTPPVTASDLSELAEEAQIVPRARLEGLLDAARAGAAWALDDEPAEAPGPALPAARTDPVAAVAPAGPRLADLDELRSSEFTGFMGRLNRLAASHDLRQFTTWSKIWEYPWLWRNALASVDWDGTRIIDVGAEMSPLPWLLATLGARVTLIETDEQWIDRWERARRALRADVDWHIVSDESLPVAPGSVDVVTSLSVIEHQPDKRRAFDEVARVLRPGGVFALSFDICEPEMGMTFPEWNGRAMTMRECEKELLGRPSFQTGSPTPSWNTDSIPAFLEWHRTTSEHHNYVTGAAVLRRRD